MRRGSVSLLLGTSLIVLLFSTSRAAPNPLPDAAASNGVRRWFTELSDDNPSVRELARRKLLMLTRADLPGLREVVKERSPLMPAESEVLRDIVTQIYLAEDPYEGDNAHGFVGVMFDLEQDFEDLPTDGVEVRHRMPGFCASRWLEDGDVILSVGNSDLIRSHEKMTDAVKSNSAGQSITFEILRCGRLIRVPVVLDARPIELMPGDSATIASFIAKRQESANTYWEENFQPLLEDPVSK
jgi:hypothetical protein